jgi:ureidoacrylate peracid hydrolase
MTKLSKKSIIFGLTLIFSIGFWIPTGTAADMASRSALLTIDVANDMMDEKGIFGSFGTAAYAKKHNTAANIAKAIGIAEQKNIPIIRIWIEYEEGMPEVYCTKTGQFRKIADKMGHFFVKGTWGAEPFSGLEPKEGQYQVFKERMNGFFNSNLDSILRGLGINTLIVTGVTARGCVSSTLVGAADRDYEVVALKDCIAGGSEEICTFLFEKVWPFWKINVTTLDAYFGN